MFKQKSFSPKFKGIVTIKKYRSEGDRLIQVAETTKENIINKRTVELLLMSNTRVFTENLRVALSSDIYPVDYERTTIDNVIAVGDPNLAGVAGYTISEATETTPLAGTYHNRFLAPSAARDFGTIAIVDGTTNNNASNITLNTFAYLSLGSLITQQDYETLDIFYRVFIDWVGNPLNFSDYVQNELSGLFVAEFSSALRYDYNELCHAIISLSNADYDMRSQRVHTEEFNSSGVNRTELLKKEYNATAAFPINRMVYGIACGRLERNGTGYLGFKGTASLIPTEMPSALGQVFSHSDNANALFHDPNELANSSWKPVITDVQELANDLPSIYALRVESSGGEGIGTYSIYKTLYSGGTNNTVEWQQVPRPLVVTQKYPDFFAEDNDLPYNPKWIYYWTDDNLWVSANNNIVAIWAIFPEFVVVDQWDLATSHSVTAIYDLATDEDNQLIYVATAQGLLEINAVADTVTVLSTDKARAVDIGYNKEIFAVLIDGTNVGRLASSLNVNWTVAHSFTGTIDYDQVIFIRCDRDSTDYNLAILELGSFLNPDAVGGAYENRHNQTFAFIHWWNNPSGYVNTIDCTITYNGNMIQARSLMFPYNSSFVVKGGTWLYPKYLQGEDITTAIDTGRTWGFSVSAEANGTPTRNADGSFNTQSLNAPTGNYLGAAKFNQEIRMGGSASSRQAYATHSHVILNEDLAGGVLRVARGGNGFYHNSSTTSFAGSAGALDYEISDSDPTVTGIVGYRGTPYNQYYFSGNRFSNYSRAVNYYIAGNLVQAKHSKGILGFCPVSISNQSIEFAGGSLPYAYYNPLRVGIWGAFNSQAMFEYDQEWSVRYGWNSASGEWEVDQDKLLPGKPLHTTQEALIDGLEIQWSDLNPSNSQDLILNQYYTFTRMPGAKGFVSDGNFSTVPFKYSYYLRPTIIYNLSETISASPFQLTLAPVSSDSRWLTLDNYDGSVIKLAIAGYSEPATVILSGSPGVNEVLISDAVAGILEFNSADTGKAVTGEVLYLQKIHDTEVL